MTFCFRTSRCWGRLIRRTEQPLTLNAIAKGTIVDSVVLALQSEFPQIEGLVVNIGGDLRVAGVGQCAVTVPAPQRDALNATPLAVLQLANQAIATSGMSERSWSVAGRAVSTSWILAQPSLVCRYTVLRW
ncbi:MAG: FAD:protein FMN transferase [Planctomyces sp.]